MSQPEENRIGRAKTINDRGEITLEFLLVAVFLFIPVVYLIIVLFQVQAATFAAEAAVSQAARILSLHPTPGGQELARDNATLALADQGILEEQAKFTINCTKGPCPGPQSTAQVVMEVNVPLPVVPTGLQNMFALQIPVRCEHAITWSKYSASGS